MPDSSMLVNLQMDMYALAFAIGMDESNHHFRPVWVILPPVINRLRYLINHIPRITPRPVIVGPNWQNSVKIIRMFH
jgi:hypothetical protein